MSDTPPELQNVILLEETLDTLNNENAKNIAKRIVLDLKYYKEIDELCSFLIMFSNTRRKINSFGELCRILYDSMGEKFKKRLLEKAPKHLLRAMYDNNIITLDEVNVKVKKDNELTFYFAPEIEIQEDLFQYYDMEYIENNFDKLKENDWKLYKELIEYGYIKETKEYAIKYDDLALLKEKFGDIEPDAMIETTPFDSERVVSYLSFAAFYGSLDCFMFLAEQKNGTIDDQVIQNAAKGGNMKIVEYIESKGFSFEGVFLSAIEYHRMDVFKHLTSKYGDGDSVFNDCISLGNISAYLYYLNCGCDPNESDCYGWTSLPLAAMNAQISLTRYLTRINCDINAVAVANTALHYACSENNCAIIKFLLDNGADTSVVDMSQQTPLHIAASKGNAKAAHLLLAKGASLTAQDEDEYTPVIFMSEEEMLAASISDDDCSFKDIFEDEKNKNTANEKKDEENDEELQTNKEAIDESESVCCLLI